MPPLDSERLRLLRACLARREKGRLHFRSFSSRAAHSDSLRARLRRSTRIRSFRILRECPSTASEEAAGAADPTDSSSGCLSPLSSLSHASSRRAWGCSVTVKHKPMPNPTVEYTTLPWVSNVWMPRLIFTASRVPGGKGLMQST